MSEPAHTAALEHDLNAYDPQVRQTALVQLAERVRTGTVSCLPETPVGNLHAHTFFSFNAYGYSPSALAWLAKKQGFRWMGIVDFDVLDGVDEFLTACELLVVRGCAGMETRIFLPEFAEREINSPGEPGVDYHMGIGFTSSRVPAEVAPILADLRQRAAHRNRLVVERLNDLLKPLCIDYTADILPLTPAGNPTERHIVQAYLLAAQRSQSNLTAFWSNKLGLSAEQVTNALQDSPKFQNLVRTRLMKRGGAGYIQPTAETFPSLAEFHRLILACGALPCAAWLDGTSQGEQDIAELLDLLIRSGAAAINMIPDRNWNIADPQTRQEKVQKLVEIVHLSGELDLPIHVGTEMNSFGQKLVVDFAAPELVPVRQAFLDGAHFIYGHTVLQRALGLGYSSPWAQSQLPSRRQRNQFFMRAGGLIPPGERSSELLRSLPQDIEPDELLALLSNLFPTSESE